MRQIVYFSTAAGVRQDPITLAAVLAVSREYNLRDKISGLLIAGGHRYLQIIEGAPSMVEATMNRIQRDDRHIGVTVLIDRELTERCFDQFSMAFCEAPRLGDFATLGHLIDHLRREVRDAKLRAQIDCLARSFIVPDSPSLASLWTLASSYDSRLALDRSH